MVFDPCLVSETAARLYRAHVSRMMAVGLSRVPSYEEKQVKLYERLARRVLKLKATPEAYIGAQYDAVDSGQARQITITMLVDPRKSGKCDDNWRGSARVETARRTRYKDEASLHLARVWYTAKELQCSMYDVVNDRHFTLPAWFRVLNSDDREIIKIYSEEAREVLASPDFRAVKEELKSVHGRLSAGI